MAEIIQPEVNLVIQADPWNPHELQHINTLQECWEFFSKLQASHLKNESNSVLIYINGNKTDLNAIRFDNIFPGDSILVKVIPTGGGDSKEIGRTVAMIGVMAASVLIPGAQGLALTGFKYFATSLAIGMGGSMLVNAILPFQPNTPEFDSSKFDELEQSQTYSWNPPRNPINEGGTLPVLYGHHRVTPYLINWYISVEGGEQRLNALYAVAEGPIDSISDVRINGQDLSVFDNIQTDTRLGSNSESPIDGFHDAISDTDVGQAVEWNAPVEAQTQGSNFDRVGVGITFPQGIYELDNEGNPQDFELKIKIQVKLGSGAYQDFVPNESRPEYIGNGQFQYTIGEQRTIRLFYYMDLASNSEQATIKVEYVNEPPNDFKHGTALTLENIHEALKQAFNYPNVALLAIKALATSELNGTLPVVDCIAEKKWVDVFTGAAWETRPANNPAFAAYDVLRHPRYGANIPAGDLIIQEFQAWADWCNIKNIQGHFYVDSYMTVAKATSMMGKLGRAVVVQRGIKFGVIVDKPEVPTQLFTVANIIKDSFNVEYLPTNDRANVVEITYFPESDNNNRQVVEIKEDDFDQSETIERKVADTLVGCINQETAVRHGKYLLNTNRLLRRAASFSAEVDAVACQPGDVVEIQNDITGWGLKGGRITDIVGNQITLDKEITLENSKTYEIVIRRGNTGVLYRESFGGDGTTNTMTLNDTTDILVHDIWSFGEQGLQTKPFRVQEIKRSHDLKVELKVTEYNELIYQDHIDFPQPTSDTTLVTVDALRLEEIWRLDESGVGRPLITARWRGHALGWNVVFLGTSPTGQGISAVSTREPYAEILPEQFNLRSGKTYYIRVQALDNPHLNKVQNITIKGKPNTPTDVTNLQAEATPAGLSLSWDSVIDTDLGGYRVKLNGEVIENEIKANSYLVGPLVPDTYDIEVSAVDLFAQESATPATLQYVVNQPSQPVISAIADKANAVFSWPDSETTFQISHYEITYPGGTLNIKSNSFSYKIESGISQTLQVVAVDIGDNRSDIGHGLLLVQTPSAPSVQWEIDGDDVKITWTDTAQDLSISHWIIDEIQVGSPQYIQKVNWLGDKSYTLTPYDVAGNAGTSTVFTVNIVIPTAPIVTHSFVGTDILIEIDQNSIQGDLPIKSFVVDGISITDNIFRERVCYASHQYSIKAIDSAGNIGEERILSVDIAPPLQAENFASSVVDNFVTLTWSDANTSGSLPLDRWEIRRGEDFETATSVLKIFSNFAHTSELQAGTHRFWVVGYDTAGNLGAEASLVAEIDEPRGFVLVDENYVTGFKPATQAFFENYHYGSKLHLKDEIKNEIWWMENVETVDGASLVTSEKKYGVASFYFDGVDGKIRTTNGSSFTMDSVFMASCWIKFDTSGSPNNSQYIFANLGGGDSRKWRLRYDRTANELQFRILAGPSVDAIAPHSTLDDGNWHFVMVGKDNSDNMHIWVDLVDLTLTTDEISGNNKNVGTPGQPLYLGAWHNSSNDFFKGWMDDVRIVADYVAPSTVTLPDTIRLPPDVRLQDAEKDYFLEDGDETEDVWVSVNSAISVTDFWGTDTINDKYGSGELLYEPFAQADKIDAPIKRWNLGVDVNNTVVDISLDRNLYIGTETDYRVEADILDSNDVILTTLTGTPNIKEFVSTLHKVDARVVDTASGNPVLMQLKGLNMRIKVREIEESGSDSVTTASTGKVITFTKSFKDVQSIVITPKEGGTAVTALYDFTDTPDPTQMTVYLYDINGNRVTGDFSYIIKGVR